MNELIYNEVVARQVVSSRTLAKNPLHRFQRVNLHLYIRTPFPEYRTMKAMFTENNQDIYLTANHSKKYLYFQSDEH